jgi:predicted dehydrogenase
MGEKTIKETIRWGIIGAGDVCEKKSGPAFGKVPDSELVAIMRRNDLKAADFAQRHGVSKFYTKADEILKDPYINAIYIATPPAFHEEYTLAALQAGNMVYVEKPVALNSSSCHRMIEAEKNYQLPVSVAHYRRGLDMFIKIREIIHSGVIGRILFVKIELLQTKNANLIAKAEENWRIDPDLSGGGLFHDLAPHQLDILIWIFGKPTNVNGFSTNQGGLYDAPDLTTLSIQFENNIHFQGIWSFNVPAISEKETCEIVGDSGKLVFSFFRNPVLELYTGEAKKTLEFPIPEHIQQPMIENVVKYFRGIGENPCSLNDAMESMKIMDSTL